MIIRSVEPRAPAHLYWLIQAVLILMLVAAMVIAGAALGSPHVIRSLLNLGPGGLAAGLPPQQLGLELYTLRKQLAKDVPGGLAQARRLGFTKVEVAGLHGLTAGQFKLALDEAGLVCPSMMASYEQLRDHLDGVAADARTLGAQYVICGWIPHKEDFLPQDCDRAINDFNRWGQNLKQQGLQFGYHIHGYEFEHYGHATLFDKLLSTTVAAYVTIEMDVFWVFNAGQDPVKLMQSYPKRISLLHVKDMSKGEEIRVKSGSALEESNVTVGTGQLDFRAILKEAAAIGVKYYFIEDESSRFSTQVPASLKYLERLTL
jgi:sugar phosphate isomerase/epimerase